MGGVFFLESSVEYWTVVAPEGRPFSSPPRGAGTGREENPPSVVFYYRFILLYLFLFDFFDYRFIFITVFVTGLLLPPFRAQEGDPL